MISLNDRFVVEPYLSDRQIQSTSGGGFALIKQKVAVKGLKLLIDARIRDGVTHTKINAGATVYIREEYLHTQPWAKQLMECEAIEGKFMIVDAQYVEFVEL